MWFAQELTLVYLRPENLTPSFRSLSNIKKFSSWVNVIKLEVVHQAANDASTTEMRLSLIELALFYL